MPALNKTTLKQVIKEAIKEAFAELEREGRLPAAPVASPTEPTPPPLPAEAPPPKSASGTNLSKLIMPNSEEILADLERMRQKILTDEVASENYARQAEDEARKKKLEQDMREAQIRAELEALKSRERALRQQQNSSDTPPAS